ncbi:5-methylcytosine rRNA methyltransferase l(2)10685 [Arctopsyche grandis]|uniref:5-methylcytosine rRNA methyltransferase l(2)10685 n=1 Tax=Arctopsyche grandis TaxID=121162 RepID=UPI00406D961B
MFSNNLFEFKSHFLLTIKRYKFIKKYWMPTKKNKKLTATDRAMAYFDDFYGSVFGTDRWIAIRRALERKHKYVAVVNNYGENENASKFLESHGAHNLRRLFKAQKEFNKNENTIEKIDTEQKSDSLERFIRNSGIAEIEEFYSQKSDFIIPEKLDVGKAIIGEQNTIKPEETVSKSIPNQSLAASLDTAKYDESRIIAANVGMRAVGLWTYVPASRLKGCEDWLPESEHYKYYSSADDYPLTIEEENELDFPSQLQVYSFESNTSNKFPEPKRGITGVYDYYLMDGASILPILALDLQPGDRVLDMCAAPGGKSLAILQTLLCRNLVTNDVSFSRVNRILKVFDEYLLNYSTDPKWNDEVTITNEDARHITDEHGFDKILVDVPCTTDRHSLKEDDNNIFKTSRIKERLTLPEEQSKILSNALHLCKVGGTVVYSTCTLSPIQNDGVVHMALKRAWEEHRVRATIKTLTKAFDPAQCLFKLCTDEVKPKFGQLVLPDVSSNFGPSYFCKIVKTQA